MASRFSRRVFVTVTAARRDAANAAAASAAPDGGAPFTAPLAAVAAPAVITHYCCEWAMQDTERTALLAGFRTQGFSVGDLDVVGNNGKPNAGKPIHLFDVEQWTADTARAALGLTTAVLPGEDY